MKNAIFLILTLAASSLSFADHHSLTLEAREAQTEWTITSIDLISTESVITVERDAGEEGRTYVSYHLSYDNNGNGGTYTANARGYVDANTVTSAYAAGVWNRDGILVIMDEIVSHSDGTKTVGRITINPLERTMVMVQYTLDQSFVQ